MQIFTRLLAFLSLLVTANAAALVIDFRAAEIEALDGASVLDIDTVEGGVRLLTSAGVFNRTAAGFGINASGSADDADAIDGDMVPEWLEIAFEHEVELHSLTFSGFGRNDAASISIPSQVLTINGSGLLELPNTRLRTSDLVRIDHLSGNGFSLDALAFERHLTAQPSLPPINPIPTPRAPAIAASEPDAIALMLAGLVVPLLARRRRKTSSSVRSAGAQPDIRGQ